MLVHAVKCPRARTYWTADPNNSHIIQHEPRIFGLLVYFISATLYGKLYDTIYQGQSRWYGIIQFPVFIAFTDFWIYWLYRGLHYPPVYKRPHKPHHKWMWPTPFPSHAFHPVDGFEVNYRQFFTFLDRLCGSYRKPDANLFEKEQNMPNQRWQKGGKEVDTLVVEIEGIEDRIYEPGD
ncbi:uncharacterized protein DNG_01379 [Cephalotrichum gorgonifer]|uniref:Fatty acid hydroxylase domain-containing protein n=1 Tax=Cephalotrichum gorgonifer TaxID=2041049 RepID=A0AAE8MQF9_9PEZI|nr:uncharacterized protein DNG_01379 [Cephalotrichum gorgonifer]